MKNKKVTYILITAVAAVWGIIFYWLFAATQQTEDVGSLPLSKPTKYESLDDYRTKDTFTLALNYRDPMLGGIEPKKEPFIAKTTPNPPLPVYNSYEQPIINNDIIKFTGYIYDQPQKRMAAIINLNGNELMLSEGQTLSGLKIIKNFKDSVKISYKNKTKFIRLE